jgi:hypothetical protein
MNARSSVCLPSRYHNGFAPFYFPIFVDQSRVNVTAEHFAIALQAEGVPLGAKYGCVVSTWPWVDAITSDAFVPTNAISTRDRTFNLHLNENYGEREVNDILDAIEKVAAAYRK